MHLNKKRKIIGTIEMALAAFVIMFSVIRAPSVSSGAANSAQVPTSVPETELSQSTTEQEVTEAPTEPMVAVSQTPQAPMEYTITNYIMVTSNAAMEMYSISKTKLTEYANVINTFQQRVPDKKVYVMLAPTRIAFYGPQEYKSGSHSQPDGIQIAYSAMNPEIVTIDAYSEINKHKNEYVYFRTDHHWTARGAYYAYTAFCKQTGDNFQPLSNYQSGESDGFVGSMYRYTQSENLKNAPDIVEYFMPLNNATGQYFSSADMADGKNLRIVSTEIEGASNKYMTFIQGDKPLIKITTDNPNGRKILLIKESYGNALAPFLCENYSEIYVLDPRQDGVTDMNLTQFVNDNGINEILFLNYMMAPSNSKYMTALNNIVNK